MRNKSCARRQDAIDFCLLIFAFCLLPSLSTVELG